MAALPPRGQSGADTPGQPAAESAEESVPQPDLTAGIRLLARLARVAERACRESGISLPQYRLLLSISGQSQRPSELAVQVGVSRPTLTSLVDGLAQAGYATYAVALRGYGGTPRDETGWLSPDRAVADVVGPASPDG